MTRAEVADKLMRKQQAPRTGLYDKPWFDTLDRWVTEGYPTARDAQGNVVFMENGKPQPQQPADVLGFDMADAGGWMDNIPIRGYRVVEQETDEWVAARDGSGALFKQWKHKSGVPEHMDFHMSSREIWERDYRPHIQRAVDNPETERLKADENAKTLANYRAKGVYTELGHGFVWEQLRHCLGDICMFESLLTDPAWIEDFTWLYLDFYKAHMALLIESAGVPDCVWVYEDLGYRNGLFCSPKILEEMFFPIYRSYVEFIHQQYDLPVVFHCCGQMERVIPMVVEAGFDGLNPMENKSGNDVVRIARTYGDKLTLVGGFNGMTLERGDRAELRAEAERIIKGCQDAGAPLFFGSDHSVSTGVSYATYQYVLDVYHRFK